jgi:hypothetical protein
MTFVGRIAAVLNKLQRCIVQGSKPSSLDISGWMDGIDGGKLLRIV